MFRYRIISFLGLFLLVGLAWLISENRKNINRKKDVAALGLKALAGGTIATFMTACFAGILI